MRKIICWSLALMLALSLWGPAFAEEPPAMLKGPLPLDANFDANTLLSASVTFTYQGDPSLIIAFDLAADKGEGEGKIGELRQFGPNATMEVTISNIRYRVIPAVDRKSLAVTFSMDCTVDGKTQQFTDTLTLRPGTADEPPLVVESPKGGEAVPTNG